MSDSDSDDSRRGDEESRRLRNILYTKKKRRNPGHLLAVDFQKLEKDAQEYVERVGENLVVEVPKTLQSVAIGSDGQQQQELSVKNHEAYLTEQTTLVIEERRKEIEATQKRLEMSLRELAAVKLKEEETLQRRVKELQKEFAGNMKTLQKQFCVQAEELRQDALRKVAQQRSQCEMAVEAKARLLSASLATGNQSSSSSNSNRGHRPNCALSDLDDSSGMSDHLHHTENSKQMHRDQQYFRDVPPKAQLSPETRRHSVGVQDARRQMIREHTIRSQRRHSSKPINGVYEREKVQPRPDIFSKTRQVQLGYLDETEG